MGGRPAAIRRVIFMLHGGQLDLVPGNGHVTVAQTDSLPLTVQITRVRVCTRGEMLGAPGT